MTPGKLSHYLQIAFLKKNYEVELNDDTLVTEEILPEAAD